MADIYGKGQLTVDITEWEIQSIKESPVPLEKQIYSGWVETYLSFYLDR